MLLAGSTVRGEATPFSDLDLVVVFDEIECAYRESFIFKNWPVEAFVHDLSTLKYFFEKVDGPSGIPSLPQMVKEGVGIPGDSALGLQVNGLAKEVLEKGPPRLSKKDLDQMRYAITDLLDDIRDPRSGAELMATGSRLYELLADFYFRAQNIWSAKGKAIPRRLEALDSEFAERFLASFQSLFRDEDPAPVIQLTETLLGAYGGTLFEGHKLMAPADWRI